MVFDERPPAVDDQLQHALAEVAGEVDRGVKDRLPGLAVALPVLLASCLPVCAQDARRLGQGDLLELGQVFEHLLIGGDLLLVEQRL